MKSNFENRQIVLGRLPASGEDMLGVVEDALAYDLSLKHTSAVIERSYADAAHTRSRTFTGADDIFYGYRSLFRGNQRLRDAELARDETQAHLMDVQRERRAVTFSQAALNILGRWKTDQYSGAIAEYRENIGAEQRKADATLEYRLETGAEQPYGRPRTRMPERAEEILNSTLFGVDIKRIEYRHNKTDWPDDEGPLFKPLPLEFDINPLKPFPYNGSLFDPKFFREKIDNIHPFPENELLDRPFLTDIETPLQKFIAKNLLGGDTGRDSLFERYWGEIRLEPGVDIEDLDIQRKPFFEGRDNGDDGQQ